VALHREPGRADDEPGLLIFSRPRPPAIASPATANSATIDPVATLGLPLWEALPADQKIAILGHEFARRQRRRAARSLARQHGGRARYRGDQSSPGVSGAGRTALLRVLSQRSSANS
jgi:hypothetical protein